MAKKKKLFKDDPTRHRFKSTPKKEHSISLLTLTTEWTAGGGAAEEARFECAEAKAMVGEGLRASAGMSTAVGVRHLCAEVTAGGW